MSTIFDTISINIKFDTNIISKEKKLKTLVFFCFANVLFILKYAASCRLSFGARLAADAAIIK